MSPEEKYKNLFSEMAKLCRTSGWGDPFSYARSKEIMTACELGHSMVSTYSGADGIKPDGTLCEYKSTTFHSGQKKKAKAKGSYTGISVQSTWEEQEQYLINDKILKYPEHYFSLFNGDEGVIEEIWMMTGQQVYDLLLPKIKKKYPEILTKKDPRLSADITQTEIKKFATRIL